MADDVCSKAQTEYDALVQAWKEKQAEAAALNEKLKAAQSCDWENGDEFDAALEQSDERFSNLNKLIRTYIQAKEAETAAAQDLQEAKKAVQNADTAKAAAEQKKAAAKEAVEHGFSENKTQFESELQAANDEESAAQSKKEAADAALNDAQTKKLKAQTSLSEAQKKYDETIVKNGELTQADVDQANTDAEEAKMR